MNSLFKKSIILITLLAMCLCVACTSNNVKNIWDDATYTEDTTLGSGSKSITVTVIAEENSVNITLKTDAENLGDALTEVNLIKGEEGDYGLMVEKVNGIKAIYSEDQSYWLFYVNDEYAMTGVDSTPISNGDCIKWVYTKE
jgi:hypothetical protein